MAGRDGIRRSLAGRSTPASSLAWLGDGGALETLAEIWATVEIERALAAIGGGGSELSAGSIDDPLLGACVLVVPTADGSIALAEPSTEGRLAATLVRYGEGPAGRYVRSPVGLDRVHERAAAVGIAISRPVSGPLGRAVLVVTGPVAGPHVILVEPQATDAGSEATPADHAAVPSPP